MTHVLPKNKSNGFLLRLDNRRSKAADCTGERQGSVVDSETICLGRLIQCEHLDLWHYPGAICYPSDEFHLMSSIWWSSIGWVLFSHRLPDLPMVLVGWSEAHGCVCIWLIRESYHPTEHTESTVLVYLPVLFWFALSLTGFHHLSLLSLYFYQFLSVSISLPGHTLHSSLSS